jgi:hypothetical protein
MSKVQQPITMTAANGRPTVFMSTKNVPVSWEGYVPNKEVFDIDEEGFLKAGIGIILDRAKIDPSGGKVLRVDYYGEATEVTPQDLINFPRGTSHFIIVDDDDKIDMVIYLTAYGEELRRDLEKRGYLDIGQSISTGGYLVY